MQTTKKIEKQINGFQVGEVFTYGQLKLVPDEYRAAVKALSRMTKAGVIKRASTGRYYKPKKSVFGELKPGEDQLLKSYLFQKGKRIAYVTGISLYNKMGLTTQVPKNIKIASRDKRIITKVGSIAVKAVKSYVDVTNDNYYLLEILDAIKDFKNIPDLNREGVLKRLQQKIIELNHDDKRKLINISLKYPPRVRALTGALLTSLGIDSDMVQPLAKSLNPLSTYNFGIQQEELPAIKQWNIV
ncbi:DUF6088 family protein [Flavihumibacter sp. UBA7668]|uniref:DUF6088 family protein n=1 Tax=Flavihumibacter sp. UBA7668 TaxID=1946542 RepID=UPI0025BDE5B3|nr:DUF6088 family protein [Flavihumibacter sp. UBA7668]